MDASLQNVMLRATLRTIVTDLFGSFECKCGEPPFVDGEQCPICFGLVQCEALGIEITERQTEPEDALP